MSAFSWHEAQLFHIMGSFCAQAICNTGMVYEAWRRNMGEIFHQSCGESPSSWASHLAWQPVWSKFQMIYRMPNASFGVPCCQTGPRSTCMFPRTLSFEVTIKQAQNYLSQNVKAFKFLNSLLHNLLVEFCTGLFIFIIFTVAV